MAVGKFAGEAGETGYSAAAVEEESQGMEQHVARPVDEFEVEAAYGQVVHLVEEEGRRNLRAEEDMVVHSFAVQNLARIVEEGDMLSNMSVAERKWVKASRKLTFIFWRSCRDCQTCKYWAVDGTHVDSILLVAATECLPHRSLAEDTT